MTIDNKELAWLLEEKYHGQKTADFFADCARLEAGEPLAYVIGTIPFLGCDIFLDSHPLIPRTETEFWTEYLLRYIQQSKKADSSLQILDLCAGSGCIGIALGKQLPKTHITFSELMSKHTQTIIKNCLKNNLSQNRFEVVTGHLFDAIPKERKFDFIISNPPYINETLGRTESSVINFEPREALYSEQNGLALISEIIKTGPDFLIATGELWIEHEPEQVQAIYDMAEKHFLVHTRYDQYGVARFTQLVLQ